MSAFSESGRLSRWKSGEIRVRFRPRADFIDFPNAVHLAGQVVAPPVSDTARGNTKGNSHIRFRRLPQVKSLGATLISLNRFEYR